MLRWIHRLLVKRRLETAALCWLFTSFLAVSTGFASGPQPVITVQPASQVVPIQGSVTFTVVATSGTTRHYQWGKNSVDIPAATNSSYTISPVTTNAAGSYSVIVTNVSGSTTSSAAILTVLLAPIITNQPQNQTGIQGQTAAFSVGAVGAAPLGYRWMLNGTNVSGATNALLMITNLQPVLAGNYRVVVANFAGAVTSAVATLTVYVPPTITSQPQSQGIVKGKSVTFSFSANGSAPFTNQWYFNGSKLSTSSSVTISSAGTSDAGNYSVVVANAGGSVTSAVATLTVYVPPSITTQPQDRTRTAGTSVTLSVVASGSAPFSYQWTLNATNISSATNASLALTNVLASDAGDYTVIVTNFGGRVTSQVATLTVNVPAFIATQPESQTVPQGQNATFTVGAGGTASLSYRWYFNGVAVSGSKGNKTELTLSTVDSSDVGGYAVVVNNSYGYATSAVATLTLAIPPTITTQPTNQTSVPGQDATFFVTANGSTPLNYQWNFQGTNLVDATNAWLALTNIQTSDAGTYAVVITNLSGSITSTAAMLTVNIPAFITMQPTSQALAQGQIATFKVAADGTAPFHYQWNFNGADISGATNAMLTLAGIQAADAGQYSVIITNVAGSATSDLANLTVAIPPIITSPPQSLDVVQGQTAMLVVEVSGTAPFTYQWYCNGTNLSDATNPSLTLTNIQASAAGDYVVVIANAAGSARSEVATLKVLVPPAITSPPQSQALAIGQPALFSVGATGTAALSYQWYFNGVARTDATSNLIVFTSVHASDAGDYSVVVTNVAGSVTSAVVNLTVTNPVITLAIGTGAGMTAGGFAFQLSVPVGITYLIMASTNLQDWTPIQTNISQTESALFTDPATTSQIQRFYRVIVP